MVFKNQDKMPKQCPPANAISKDVEPVYRYIDGDVLKPIDFENHIERGLSYRPEQSCEAIALSFYKTEEAAVNLAKRFKKFKRKSISKGKITAECGIHNTINNHLNLWVYKDVDMIKVFTGEEKGNENKKTS
jgi:hypothetical protein